MLFFAFAVACGSDKDLSGGILIASEQDGDWEVLVVDPENGTARQLTDNRAYDTRALWSPDRTRLVFTSDRLEGKAYEAIFLGDEPTRIAGEETGARHILVMQTDNLEVFQLTEEGSADHASWSPDGSRIAFINDKGKKLVAAVMALSDLNGGVAWTSAVRIGSDGTHSER